MTLLRIITIVITVAGKQSLNRLVDGDSPDSLGGCLQLLQHISETDCDSNAPICRIVLCRGNWDLKLPPCMLLRTQSLHSYSSPRYVVYHSDHNERSMITNYCESAAAPGFLRVQSQVVYNRASLKPTTMAGRIVKCLGPQKSC